LENVPTIAVVEPSSSRASNFAFSIFFVLEIAILCSAQLTVISEQWTVKNHV
jgi:hypothetical protein